MVANVFSQKEHKVSLMAISIAQDNILEEM